MFYAVRNVAIGAATLALAAGFSLPAKAAYTVTFSQVGADVDASGGGTIDLNGLTFITSGSTTPEVAPAFATEATGAAGAVNEYSGASGPVSFGSGVFTSATTGTGDLVGIQQLIGEPAGFVFVPTNYASGATLSDTAAYTGQTSPRSASPPAPTNGHGERARPRTASRSRSDPSQCRNPLRCRCWSWASPVSAWWCAAVEPERAPPRSTYHNA